METYKKSGIKDIITEFPRVGEILSDYGIGCVSCTVGICRLKDIVDMHTLPPAQEKELMACIEAVIYPERKIETTLSAAAAKPEENQHIFSPPMQVLVDEHTVIKRWLTLIPALIEGVDLTGNEGRQIYLDGLDFIRSYADRLHHGKEEDILFTYFDDSSKIFQVIYEDHRLGRNHVTEMHDALERGDKDSLHHHLCCYHKLLTEHIDKEDEILFPWLDRMFSPAQVTELNAKFKDKDNKSDIEQIKYQVFVERLENQFIKNNSGGHNHV